MFSYKIDPRASILGWITTQVEVYEKKHENVPAPIGCHGNADHLGFSKKLIARSFFRWY